MIEKKNQQLRICLDPKPLNATILCEHYNISTPADVRSKLSNEALFTLIDMKDAYWHVKLSPESSYRTTFHTPWGRKLISQRSNTKRNENTFGGLHGVHIAADDLIIAARNEKQHDRILLPVLQRARDRVRFNKNKI